MKTSVYEVLTYHDVTGSKVGIVLAMSPQAAQNFAARLLEKATSAVNAQKLAKAKRRKS